jgi:hypothetical protein
MGDAVSPGVSVVIPTGGAARLHLLDAMLGWLQRCDGVDQIVLSELGEVPLALDVARRRGVDHIFTPMRGAFDRAAARNAGIALARCETLLWCDGDLIFGRDFVRNALRELHARKLDYLAPFSSVEYLDPAQSAAVIAGQCDPAGCRPIRVLEPLWKGAPGGMWLVRRDFLRRHGGIPTGFKGWGHEDDAWLHKAALLGRIGATERSDQRAWHLFHPDSGSHSPNAASSAIHANPHHLQNYRLLERMQAIHDAAEWQHHFAPPAHAAAPWPEGARIAFVTVEGDRNHDLADRWAARLGATYGVTIPVLRAAPAALRATIGRSNVDALVGFVGDAAVHVALRNAAQDFVTVLVAAGDVPAARWNDGAPPMALVRDKGAIAAWRDAGYPVWHRPWAEDRDESAAPALVQPLSHLLTCPRAWQVRIVIDRAALAPSAFDRARFWYVGLHDEEDVELLREDLLGPELRNAIEAGDGPIVISRALRSTRRPARWTVWPTDRRGCWLDKVSGDIAPDGLVLGDAA